jgi:hypothetical protein
MTLLDTHHAARPVEIGDWVRALGRRVRLILIVPLAAGALAGVLALTQGQQYRTSTSVVIPHPQSIGSVAAAVSQDISDFQGALGLTQTASLTASQTGASQQHVQAGLSSKRAGDGNSVVVVYVGTNPDTALKVVVAASKNALTALAQADLNLASGQLTAAKSVYNEAVDNEGTLVTQTGVVDFQTAISAYEKRLSDARDQLGRAQASGDETAIAAAQAKVTAITAVAGKLKTGYQQANDRLTVANQALATAQDAQIQAQGELTAAESVSLRATPAVGLSRASHAAKRVVPAMVFGLVLAAGVVVLLELLRPAAGPTRP